MYISAIIPRAAELGPWKALDVMRKFQPGARPQLARPTSGHARSVAFFARARNSRTLNLFRHLTLQ